MSKDYSSRRQSGRQKSSQGATKRATISVHLHDVPIDVTTMPSIALRRAFDDPSSHYDLFSRLDFVNIADSKLKQLFYNEHSQQQRCIDRWGNFIFPPPALRRTAKQIRTFIQLGPRQKAEQITEYQHFTIDLTSTINYMQSSFHVTPSTPEKPIMSAPALDPTLVAPTPLLPSKCSGVSINYISDMRYSQERRDEVTLGFIHTVREGWSTRQRLESPTNVGFAWLFCLPVVICLTDGIKTSEIVWNVEESKESDTTTSDFDKFTIKHVDCGGDELISVGSLCFACESKKRRLFERFDSNKLVHFTIYVCIFFDAD